MPDKDQHLPPPVWDKGTERHLEADVRAIADGIYEQKVGDYRIVSATGDDALQKIKKRGKPLKVFTEQIGEYKITHAQVPLVSMQLVDTSWIPQIAKDIGWWVMVIVLCYVLYVMVFYKLWTWFLSLRDIKPEDMTVRERWAEEQRQAADDDEQWEQMQEWGRKQAEKKARRRERIRRFIRWLLRR